MEGDHNGNDGNVSDVPFSFAKLEKPLEVKETGDELYPNYQSMKERLDRARHKFIYLMISLEKNDRLSETVSLLKRQQESELIIQELRDRVKNLEVAFIKNSFAPGRS